MQATSKAKLTIEERTFRALQEIYHKAARTEDGQPTEDIMLDALVNWTTDDVRREGKEIVGDWDPAVNSDPPLDLPRLFNFVVFHVNAQNSAQTQISQAEEIIADLEASNIDTDKLGNQDEEEWDRLFSKLAARQRGEEEDDGENPFGFLDDENFDLESALAGAGEAMREGTAEEVGEAALLDRVDQQAQASLIIAEYLHAVQNGEGRKAHAIIDQFECGLTHALTNLIFQWIESRQVLPEAMDLTEWIAGIGEIAQRTRMMSKEDKLELGRHFLEHDDEED